MSAAAPAHRVGDRHATLQRLARSQVLAALFVDELPVHADQLQLIEDTRAAICHLLHGRDDRLLVIVGPCSCNGSSRILMALDDRQV